MKTTVTMLLDESTSMQPHAADVRKTFGHYINGLKTEGVEGKVNLFTFSDKNPFNVFEPDACQPTCRAIRSGSIKKFKTELEASEYTPCGNTPLYDAIGHAIKATRRQTKDKKRGVLFVIHTDGEENSSRTFSQSRVSNLIKKMEKKGWTFVYLGEDQDAWDAANRIGVRNVANMGSSITSRTGALRDLSHATVNYAANTASCDSVEATQTSSFYHDAGLDPDAHADK